MPKPDFVAIFPGKCGKLAMCRMEAQGQWFRMQMLMCESTRYGHLCTQDGSSLPTEIAARGCGLEVAHYELGLAELSEVGLIHTDRHGVIFDPEMVQFAKEWSDYHEWREIRREQWRLHKQKRRAQDGDKVMSTQCPPDIPQPVNTDHVFVLTPNSLSSKESNTSEVLLPAWLPLEAWEEYTKKVRPKLKAPNTPLAHKRLINQLNEFRLKGLDPKIIIENAILYGWKGFWEPKENGGSNEPLGRGEREAAATRAEAVRRLGQKSNSR